MAERGRRAIRVETGLREGEPEPPERGRCASPRERRAAQPLTFLTKSHFASTMEPSDPSARCGAYWMSSSSNTKVTSSDGTSPVPTQLIVFTKITSKLIFMNVLLLAPLLRISMCPSGMAEPVTHLSNSCGEAELNGMTTTKSPGSAFPAPAPPVAEPSVTGFEAPQLKDSSSIHFACCSSTESPSIPSSLRNRSVAMASLPEREDELPARGAGCGPIDVRAGHAGVPAG